MAGSALSPAVEKLRSALRGPLLLPGEDGYEQARRVYNGAVDRKPGLIARCAGADDVLRAVEFAREQGVRTSVRGGGHNVAGRAMNDGGLVIDLSAMKGMRVDPKARTARAQPGLRYRDFDSETQAFGLATTGGTVSETGISGLTLGGGVGWLMRLHGMACDNLISADVVTSEGRFLTASEQENADLFWALRGGGGQFGAVTSFKYRLHPVGQFLSGMLVHPISRAREMLRRFRDFAAAAPDEVSAFAALMHSPDGLPILAMPAACFGDPSAAAAKLAPLREAGPPVADTIQPASYCALNQALDPGFPGGLRNYWKANYISRMTDEVIDLAVEAYSQAPSPLAILLFELLGGAAARVPLDSCAFHLRSGEYNVCIVARWNSPAEDERNIEWARGVSRSLLPVSLEGGYLNYLPAEEADPLTASFGPDKAARLRAIKRKYDPSNFFGLGA